MGGWVGRRERRRVGGWVGEKEGGWVGEWDVLSAETTRGGVRRGVRDASSEAGEGEGGGGGGGFLYVWGGRGGWVGGWVGKGERDGSNGLLEV